MPLLLHMADVHLGARHDDLGEAASRQRERQFAAFRRALDVARDSHAGLVLISGDLFDSNAQPRRSVERAAAELRRVADAGIHVAVIPGTHDVYDGRSIYRALDLAELAGLPPGSDLLTVLTPERPECVYPDLDIVVYGRVFDTKRAPRSPLEGFHVADDRRATWKVGMIHGSRQIEGVVDRDEVIFSDAEVAASGLDYLALGHWHSFSQGRAGRTLWAYPGAPEPMAADQKGAGNVCLVRLEEGPSGRSVRLDRVTVGRTVFRTEVLDAAGLRSQEDLVARLAAQAARDLVLEVEVRGIASDSLEIHPQEVEGRLADSFLHLRVRDRSVTDATAAPELPADTVAGRFIIDIEARVHEAEAAGDPVAAEQARQVLRLGRRLLLDDPSRVSLA